MSSLIFPAAREVLLVILEDGWPGVGLLRTLALNRGFNSLWSRRRTPGSSAETGRITRLQTPALGKPRGASPDTFQSR